MNNVVVAGPSKKYTYFLKFLHEAFHHAWIAAIIASLLLFAEHGELLGWLDTLSIEFAQVSSNDNQPNISGSVGKDVPFVAYIGDDLYKKGFLQTLPLNRDKLAVMINSLSDQEPAKLVIDIDLSPGADDPAGDSTAQKKLDNYLSQAAKKCKKDNPCLILAPPLPDYSTILNDERKQKKEECQSEPKKLGCQNLVGVHPAYNAHQYEWMKARCIAGAEFALPYFPISQSVATSYYSKNTPTLGNVAQSNNNNGLCSHIKTESVEDFNKYHDELFNEAKESNKKLNPEYFKLLRDNRTFQFNLEASGVPAYLEFDGKMTDMHLHKPLKDKVLFFGGNYGDSDKFITTSGMQSGVVIHAAGSYSLKNPVNETHVSIAFLLDIFFGVVLGFIFVWCWKKYFSLKKKYLDAESWGPFCRVRLMLVLNVALLLLLTYILLYISGGLMNKGYWLNPGPISIGMFLHSLLASREEPQEHQGHHRSGWRYLLGALMTKDIVWQGPCVLFAIGLLIRALIVH